MTGCRRWVWILSLASFAFALTAGCARSAATPERAGRSAATPERAGARMAAGGDGERAARPEIASAEEDEPALDTEDADAEGAEYESELEEEIDPEELDQALVVEGSLTLIVDDVDEAARALTDRAGDAGARVVRDTRSREPSGAFELVETKFTAVETVELTLRVPPEAVDDLVAWIEDLGELEHRHIQAEDVSRELRDREIELQNLEHTLERLRDVLEREDIEMEQVLAVESEMSRVRGEIESLQGEKRWLRDRVALATLEVTLGAEVEIEEEDEPVEIDPEARIYPGPRGSALTLLDPDGRTRTRLGVGAVVHPLAPGGDEDDPRGRTSFEIDIFEGPEDEPNALLATVGGDFYSEFMGDGQNRVLNPYLGARLGYAYLDGHQFAFAGSAGVELFKTRYTLFDLGVRGVGLAGQGGFDPAVVTSGSFIFAF